MGTTAQSQTVLVEQLTDAELMQTLDKFSEQITEQGSLMHYILETEHREYFQSWARHVEIAFERKLIEIKGGVKGIGAYMRHYLIAGGHENAVPYMYDSIDSKYKERRPNQKDGTESDNGLQNSSLLRDPTYELENAKYIKLLEELRAGLTLVIGKMRNGSFIQALLARRAGESPADHAKRLAEFEQEMIMLYASVQLLHEIFDDRQGVPASTQHLLLGCAVELNVNEAGALYMTRVKDRFDLTRKRTVQIVTHIIRSATKDGAFDYSKIKQIKGKLHVMFEPVDAQDAREKGFTGHECPKCACLRTNRRYRASNKDEIYCWGCGAWSPFKSDPIYRNKDSKVLSTTTGPDGRSIITASPLG